MLVTGYWLLVTGYWLLGAGYSDQIALNPSLTHSAKAEIRRARSTPLSTEALAKVELAAGNLVLLGSINLLIQYSNIPLTHHSSRATEAGHGSENRASEGGYSSNIYHKTGIGPRTIVIFSESFKAVVL